MAASSEKILSKSLRKIIITLLVGTLTFTLTNVVFRNAELIWIITISVFISGIVFVVQFLLDTENQLQEVSEEQAAHNAIVRELLRSGFAQVNEATELFVRTESAAISRQAILDVVVNGTALSHEIPQLAKDFAEAEVTHLAKVLLQLNQGSIAYEGEDREWLLNLARHTSESIDALSMPTVDRDAWNLTAGFWGTDLGQRYLQILRERANKGVRIRRIFIHSGVAPADAELLQTWQAELRTEVRLLDVGQLPPTQSGWLADFVVFDNAMAYETTPVTHLTKDIHMMTTQLSIDREWVRTLGERFNVLWEKAVPL